MRLVSLVIDYVLVFYPQSAWKVNRMAMFEFASQSFSNATIATTVPLQLQGKAASTCYCNATINFFQT